MRNKIAALAVLVFVSGLFFIQRAENALPTDFRDAVKGDFDTSLLSFREGSGTPSVPPVSSASRAADSGPGAAPPRDYGRTAPALIDAQATEAAKKLYKFLRSQYGNRILSGQTSAYFTELKALAGKTPVVRSFDMQNYSPHNPWHADWTPWDDGTVQAAIDWYNGTGKKGIVTFQWHWFSPSSGQLRTSIFYTNQTAFDVSKAVAPGNPEYTEVIRDIDAIAVQLKRLSDAGVPVLWRPLHEAGGRWFWWGAKGEAASLKLYDIMYERLTNHHQLHNLIWVWSTPEAAWYPGNAKVDMVGFDSYPGPHIYATQKETFDRLYALTGGRKLIALSENGPIPDMEECFRQDAKWAYFLSWSDLVAAQNTTPHIQAVFAHPKVATLENY